MKSLEDKIKDFAHEQGIECVGIAGPDRLLRPPTSPPSLDPTFIMRGAKSIISFALPMNVQAIYDFLSKKSATPHNIDQKKGVQKGFWKGTHIQEYLKSLGHRAKVVPTNSDYRRSPDPFATHPSFSHRFGAIAAGIAAQGWSGNVMTKEYGAGIFMGTVVTDAVLKSDPALDPRYFIDGFCSKCKLCAQTCPVQMFDGGNEEEYILMNGEQHPRAKRFNIDLCNTSCFGLHALSKDKKWSSYGRYWLDNWVENLDSRNKFQIYTDMLNQGVKTGTSFRRYEVIRRMANLRWPESYYHSLPDTENLPKDEAEQERIHRNFSVNKLGVKTLNDYNVSTCGQCALICGPTLTETSRRYQMLIESGIVVPGPGGKMTRVDTYEEAVAMKNKYPDKLGFFEKLIDRFLVLFQFQWFYWGFNPKSVWQGLIYGRALKKSRNLSEKSRKLSEPIEVTTR